MFFWVRDLTLLCNSLITGHKAGTNTIPTHTPQTSNYRITGHQADTNTIPTVYTYNRIKIFVEK